MNTDAFISGHSFQH